MKLSQKSTGRNNCSYYWLGNGIIKLLVFPIREIFRTRLASSCAGTHVPGTVPPADVSRDNWLESDNYYSVYTRVWCDYFGVFSKRSNKIIFLLFLFVNVRYTNNAADKMYNERKLCFNNNNNWAKRKLLLDKTYYYKCTNIYGGSRDFLLAHHNASGFLRAFCRFIKTTTAVSRGKTRKDINKSR